MALQKRWGFGLGTIFSLILAYFVYLYSKKEGWALLAFASKWYLIIVGIIITLPLAIVLAVLLFSLALLLLASVKLKSAEKKYKKQKDKYIDAEFRIKD
ncbi:hypothetical protein HYS31_00905 [Candidatus Woesearchaeota archaeon]|nr:hypothetical protein [Candidatus Woesearchaeota archaeon]